MTSNEEKMLKAKSIGSRLRELIKEYDEKNSVTAAYLSYSEKTISHYCTGRQIPSDIVIEKLSKKWGIREEYIRCEDDFKTDADILHAIEHQNSEDFLYQKAYLETLGFKTNLKYTLFCSKTAVYRNKEVLIPFLCEDSIAEIENDTDFSLPQIEFRKKYIGKDCVLNLKRPLTEEISNAIGITHKKSTITACYTDSLSDGHFVIPCDRSPISENCIFSVWFDVYYKGQHLGLYEIDDIQKLFNIIDAHTRSTLETLLVNETRIIEPSIPSK